MLRGGATGLRSQRAAREANRLYELLLVAGVSKGGAAVKVAALFNPPRATAGLGRLPDMSLVGGSMPPIGRPRRLHVVPQKLMVPGGLVTEQKSGVNGVTRSPTTCELELAS